MGTAITLSRLILTPWGRCGGVGVVGLTQLLAVEKQEWGFILIFSPPLPKAPGLLSPPHHFPQHHVPCAGHPSPCAAAGCGAPTLRHPRPRGTGTPPVPGAGDPPWAGGAGHPFWQAAQDGTVGPRFCRRCLPAPARLSGPGGSPGVPRLRGDGGRGRDGDGGMLLGGALRLSGAEAHRCEHPRRHRRCIPRTGEVKARLCPTAGLGLRPVRAHVTCGPQRT